MDLTVTLKCNNRCVICPRFPYLSHIACTSEKDIYRSIEHIRSKSNQIVLSGGEVTLLNDFFKILTFCRNLEFEKIGIVTNGRRLKDYIFAKKLVEAGINDFAVSLYSLKPKIHDQITCQSGSCLETKKGLMNLLKLSKTRSFSLRVNLVALRSNLCQIPDIVKNLSQAGVKNFILAEQIVLPRGVDAVPSVASLKECLVSVNNIDLSGTLVRLRGFASCLLQGKKNKHIIHEPHDINTFDKRHANKKAYLSLFKDCFFKTTLCKKCSEIHKCPGLQKAYFKQEGA